MQGFQWFFEYKLCLGVKQYQIYQANSKTCLPPPQNEPMSPEKCWLEDQLCEVVPFLVTSVHFQGVTLPFNPPAAGCAFARSPPLFCPESGDPESQAVKFTPLELSILLRNKIYNIFIYTQGMIEDAFFFVPRVGYVTVCSLEVGLDLSILFLPRTTRFSPKSGSLKPSQTLFPATSW